MRRVTSRYTRMPLWVRRRRRRRRLCVYATEGDLNAVFVGRTDVSY